MHNECVIKCRNLSKVFGRGGIPALDGLSFEIPKGTVVGLMGPDGAGKTTLLRILCSLYMPTKGELEILGMNPRRKRSVIQRSVGYMPQKFGLYEDLTVTENLDLYGELWNIPLPEKKQRTGELLEMAGLGRFGGRPAGKLSGGMKQKLALICVLLPNPPLLLLDEPTVGVDVLSRRELWTILAENVRKKGLTALVSTSYMDESGYCDRTMILYQGRLLLDGQPGAVAAVAAGKVFIREVPDGVRPRTLQRQLADSPEIISAAIDGRKIRCLASDAGGEKTVEPRFEDGFLQLIAGHLKPERKNKEASYSDNMESGKNIGFFPETADVKVEGLVKRFGNFTAVDHISFEVRRGEIFGLLGANGAGKSTTFRMLCGLLGADEGTLEVGGVNLRYAPEAARGKLGFVAQKFSLYTDLSISDNLEFFGGAYGLAGDRLKARIDWALDSFGLRRYAKERTALLPGGYKQRLSMACALLHEPEILFLDELTSGADPAGRADFWRRITGLADKGTTVIITTHLLDEAEYCDRMLIMADGKTLATGTPAEIRAMAGRDGASLEEAFLAVIERNQQDER